MNWQWLGNGKSIGRILKHNSPAIYFIYKIQNKEYKSIQTSNFEIKHRLTKLTLYLFLSR